MRLCAFLAMLTATIAWGAGIEDLPPPPPAWFDQPIKMHRPREIPKRKPLGAQICGRRIVAALDAEARLRHTDEIAGRFVEHHTLAAPVGCAAAVFPAGYQLANDPIRGAVLRHGETIVAEFVE